MSYFDTFDGPSVADYARDREREQDMERWHTRRSIMDRYAVTPRYDEDTTSVEMQVGWCYERVWVALPGDIGRRARVLADQHRVLFRRFSPGMRSGHDAQDDYVLTCRLPDGRNRSITYPPRSGVALELLPALLDWAEQEMGVVK
jgi:hypothetical protein